MKTRLLKAAELLISLPLLPFAAFIHVIRGAGGLWRKAAGLVAVIFVLFPVWLGVVFALITLFVTSFNLVPRPVPISGTGSMAPTFPKGQAATPKEQAQEVVARPAMMPYPYGIMIAGRRLFEYKIRHGDIVVFRNVVTDRIEKEKYGEASGFVKRVVGLGGDTVEVRDGIVYRNGMPLREPYTLRARSTFGGTTLAECSALKVPASKLLVMGDNRKGSDDSRHEVGLIDIKDVRYVLPLTKQRGVWDSRWRDTSTDLAEESKIRLDKDSFLALLNAKRQEAGVPALSYNARLTEATRLRGQAILRSGDFSYEAGVSGYPMKRAMSDAGYSNIVTGESISQGYYESEELIDNIFAFSKSAQFVLTPEYDEIGLSEVEGAVAGCPTQVVVAQFGGYVPPDYEKDTIDSWQKLLDELLKVQPSWQNLKESEGFYTDNKENIDKINQIIDLRITRTRAILSRMRANEWLTAEEEKWTDEDESLNREQDELAKKLIEKTKQ